MFWGLSSALDLLGEYFSVFNEKEVCPPLNVLLFGANDPRHVIKTMAKLYQHRFKDQATVPPPLVHFYLVDGCIEIVARNMALLALALERPEIINLHQKVHLFMDIFGNSMMRASSQQYLVGKSKTLLNILIDNEYLQRTAPIFDISNLKYRERDGLENAFYFWLPKEQHVFNIQEYWADRVRKLLGIRYDYREGAFDWDLNMVLKERAGNQLCSQEYRYWRNTGIAFTYPEYEYTKPNKTLSVGLVRNGVKFLHRGYLGDIQSGPFTAFGVVCSDERFTKSAHGTNDYRATDITERNLLEYFHEIATRNAYEHNISQSRKYGAVQLQMGKCLTFEESDLSNLKDYSEPFIAVEEVRIHFLSADEILHMQEDVRSGRWHRFFDVVFVGHNYFSFVKEQFTEVLKDESLLILESKLMTTGRKNEVQEFEQSLHSFAKATSLKPVLNYNALNSMNMVCKFKKGAGREDGAGGDRADQVTDMVEGLSLEENVQKGYPEHSCIVNKEILKDTGEQIAPPNQQQLFLEESALDEDVQRVGGELI